MWAEYYVTCARCKPPSRSTLSSSLTTHAFALSLPSFLLPSGHITVTDPDTIEKSNLNRQFLFRPWDVTKPKSSTAATAVTQMNPSCKVTAQLDKLAPETEDVFDDDFWEVCVCGMHTCRLLRRCLWAAACLSACLCVMHARGGTKLSHHASAFCLLPVQGLSGVCNALDNVRLYATRDVCIAESLLESGALGAKGNVQVVIPRVRVVQLLQDPPKSIPVCTLKNFPNAIEHCIQWSRDLFEGYYSQSANDVNAYLSQPDYLSQLERQPGVRKPTLEAIRTNLCEKPISVEECIVWARLRFEELYNNSIQQLLHNFPLDMLTSSGAPFWSGPKRPPTPLASTVRTSSTSISS